MSADAFRLFTAGVFIVFAFVVIVVVFVATHHYRSTMRKIEEDFDSISARSASRAIPKAGRK